MMTTPTSAPPPRKRRDITRRRWLDGVSLLSLLAALLLIFATGIFGAQGLREPRPALAGLWALPTPTLPPTATIVPTLTNTPLPTLTPTPSAPTVAIVVGHRGNDSGAICEWGAYAGTQEVQVTTAAAAQLASRLVAQGYTVIDLDEFDARLDGLKAAALVSIHADSCVDWEGTTGFKVARATNSAIPEEEDRFVACMEREYGEVTSLPVHSGSITHNMTYYHAFRKVDPTTPAIIIEVGFLYYDHALLTGQPEVVGEGLAQGVSCFLNGESPAPTITPAPAP